MEKRGKFNRQGGQHSKENEKLREVEKVIKEATTLADVDLDLLIDYAESFVKKHLCRVKTHQIRRFFDSVKNIQKSGDFSKREKAKLLMLRPQLANASAKERSLKQLAEICTIMIKKVDSPGDFDNFANFFESLVAFHKAHAFSG